MKTVQMISLHKLNWIYYLMTAFKGYCNFQPYNRPKADENPDLMMFMWSDEDMLKFINENEKKCAYIIFIRAYDYYNDFWRKVDIKKIDRILMVSDFLADMVGIESGYRPEVIANGVDFNIWKFGKRGHGKKIAMVCHIHHKKNIPLALQILAELPDEYELHIAGGVQSADLLYYIEHFGEVIKKKIYVYGHIEDINLWLEDKNYILSTSLREGSPNNVIEAMAKGIKPIIHAWGGSEIFGKEFIFTTVREALPMFDTDSEYESEKYLSICQDKFSMKNYQRIREICGEILGENWTLEGNKPPIPDALAS